MRNNCFRTRLHRLLEAGAWLVWLAALLTGVYGVCTLPEEIITHYAWDGTPDGYGSPAVLLLLPLLMLPALGIISLVAHRVDPALWNTPFVVREERKALVYADMTALLHAVQLEIAVYALYTQISVYRQHSVSLAVLALWTAALAATILGSCVRAYRHNR